jgi:hypothetical protein
MHKPNGSVSMLNFRWFNRMQWVEFDFNGFGEILENYICIIESLPRFTFELELRWIVCIIFLYFCDLLKCWTWKMVDFRICDFSNVNWYKKCKIWNLMSSESCEQIHNIVSILSYLVELFRTLNLNCHVKYPKQTSYNKDKSAPIIKTRKI